jgi:CRISPR-associated protein Cas2
MWMIVLFDLPVVDPIERKEATCFRNFLMDEGFSMSQYSVYMRLVSGKEAAEQYAKRIKMELPQRGKVDIINITDKQYENIISYESGTKSKQKGENKQYILL